MKKKVAAIVTEYRYNSHADVILGRLLNEFEYPSKIEIVSMFTDQNPENDMSKTLGTIHGFTIYAAEEFFM